MMKIASSNNDVVKLDGLKKWISQDFKIINKIWSTIPGNLLFINVRKKFEYL